MYPSDSFRISPGSASSRLRGESARRCTAFKGPRVCLLAILFAFVEASWALMEYIHTEIVNGLSVSLVSHHNIGFKHKWFFLRCPDTLEDYSSSQVLTTLDLKMDT